MLHLRRCILAHLLSSPATSPIAPLHRLLSAASPSVSPDPSFAVEDYLVDTCGLNRAQALKASTKLSHLKSPSKPNAVLAFLAGLGFSGADIAAAVATDPQLLCASVEKTLASNVAGLTGLGLSHTEIAHLVSLTQVSLRQKYIVSNLPYCLSLFGSFEKLFQAIKSGSYLLSCNLENTVKPTVVYLHGCGLGACHIANLFMNQPWIVTTKPERLQAMVACAEGLGVPRGSAMFRHVLNVVGFRSEENIAAKIDYLKKTLGWSDAEVGIAVRKNPMVLTMSKNVLRSKSDFLISEVGLQLTYIAHRPALLTYSLEGRLKPRYYTVKFLRENGLVKHDPSYFTVVQVTEKVLVEKYICPHKEVAPRLAEGYAKACRGEVTTRFRFA